MCKNNQSTRNWFKTYKRPFNYKSINKYNWLKRYAYNDDIKQMIDIIFILIKISP